MIKNLNKRFLVLSIISVLVASAVVFSSSTPSTMAESAPPVGGTGVPPSPVTGWIWSSNIGWGSANSSNAGSGGGSYGLEKAEDGTLTGYIWSSNIGWIKFGGLSSFPTISGAAAGANARILGGVLTGWARVCAGTASGICSSMTSRTDGWDGWIELSGANHSVNWNSATGALTGYAWGDDVVGWISFDLSTSVGIGSTPIVTTNINPNIGITGGPGPNCYVNYPVSTIFTIVNPQAGYTYHYDMTRDGNPAYSGLFPSLPQNVEYIHPWTVMGTYVFTAWSRNNGNGSVSLTSSPITIVVPDCAAPLAPLSISLKVHDDRYGDRISTADEANPTPAIPTARVRKGIPFKLTGTIDVSRFDTNSVTVNKTPKTPSGAVPMMIADHDQVIGSSGKSILQTDPLVRYRLVGENPGATLWATIDVQLIDPALEEI